MPQIHVDFIRHGHSCSNLAQDLRGFGLYYKFVENDPELSSLGQEMAVVVEQNIRDNNPQRLVRPCPNEPGERNEPVKMCPHYLYSSPLRRAIETAHTMWPTQQIVIAPHLLEHGIGHENVPLPRLKQEQLLVQRYPDLQGKLVQHTIDSKIASPKDPKSPKAARSVDAYKTHGNLEKFIEWLHGDLGELPSTDGDIFVSVVTHSILMKGSLGLSAKPNNQSIFRVSWNIDRWNNTPKGLKLKGHAIKMYNGLHVDRSQLMRGKQLSTQCEWYGKF